MTTNNNKDNNIEQYLPTPPYEFWCAFWVVRNYLLILTSHDLYGRLKSPLLQGKYDVRKAFDYIDDYSRDVKLEEAKLGCYQ